MPSNGQHGFTGLDKPESTSILTFFFVPCLRMHSIQNPCRFISPIVQLLFFFSQSSTVCKVRFSKIYLSHLRWLLQTWRHKRISLVPHFTEFHHSYFLRYSKIKLLVTYLSTSQRHWLGGLADAVKTSCIWARYVTKALTNIFAHSLALASSGVHQRWDFAAFCATPCECRQRTTAKPPASTLYC